MRKKIVLFLFTATMVISSVVSIPSANAGLSSDSETVFCEETKNTEYFQTEPDHETDTSEISELPETDDATMNPDMESETPKNEPQLPESELPEMEPELPDMELSEETKPELPEDLPEELPVETTYYEVTISGNADVYFTDDLKALKNGTLELAETDYQEKFIVKSESEKTKSTKDSAAKNAAIQAAKKKLPEDIAPLLNETSYDLLMERDHLFSADELVGFYVVPDSGNEVDKVTAYSVGGVAITDYGNQAYEMYMPESDVILEIAVKPAAPESKETQEEESETVETDVESEEKLSEETLLVECTCMSESPDPYEHDWDCDLFLEAFLQDCTCWGGAALLPSHEFDCVAVQKVFSSSCTCEVGKADGVMHNNCEVIKKLHQTLCSCEEMGNEYRIDEMIDQHEESSAIVQYLLQWENYCNVPMTLAPVTGTLNWDTASVPFAYGSSGFHMTKLKDVTFGTKFSKGEICQREGSNDYNSWFRSSAAHARDSESYIYMKNAGIMQTSAGKKTVDVKIYLWCTKGHVSVKTLGKNNYDEKTIAVNGCRSLKDCCISDSIKDQKISMEIHFYNSETKKEVSVKGAAVLQDIDKDEGYQFIQGIKNVYTTPDCKLAIATSGYYPGFYIGTEGAGTFNRDQSMQITYDCSPGKPLKIVYGSRGGYGMSITDRLYTITYHLVGTIPEGVTTPVSVGIVHGANTKEGVTSYGLTDYKNVTGFSFSKWRTGSISGSVYTGNTYATGNVNLYGQYIGAAGSYHVKKYDVKDKILLKDAVFELLEWNKTENKYVHHSDIKTPNSSTGLYDTGTLTYTSNNKGRFRFVEKTAPAGYDGGWSMEFNILDTANEAVFDAPNTYILAEYGTVSIIKKDSVTGENITATDGEFQVWQWSKAQNKYLDNLGINGKITWENPSEKYVSENLTITDDNLGKFKVVETRNPTGYEGEFEKEFVLTESEVAMEVELEAANNPLIPPSGEITVTKKIKESDITWAHGTPVFRFKVSGVDINGESHTYADYVELRKGSYNLEGDYATMCLTFKNIPIGKYTISEKETLRYKFESVAADTSNASISGESGIVSLDMGHLQGGVTFTNEKTNFGGYSHTDVLKNTIPIKW